MYKEFEGRTEQEAINQAIEALHIEREDFDVEIMDSGKKGLFKKGMVKIRVHIYDPDEEEDLYELPHQVVERQTPSFIPLEPNNDIERSVIAFVAEVLTHMGFPGKVEIAFRQDNKLGLNIESSHSNIIIGKKGKNLDALQLLANVYIGKDAPQLKIVIDSENYRMRHEEQIVRLAYKTAEQVKRSGHSRLLEPMNPFERRLIHTALNDIDGIETKSEGEGLYKQVRISSTGNYIYR